MRSVSLPEPGWPPLAVAGRGLLGKAPATEASRGRKCPWTSYELRLGRASTATTVRPATARRGAGDGFNAFNLDPRPRDLSDPALQKKKSDAEFADTIRRGGAGVGLSALMPPWGHTLSPARSTR